MRRAGGGTGCAINAASEGGGNEPPVPSIAASCHELAAEELRIAARTGFLTRHLHLLALASLARGWALLASE